MTSSKTIRLLSQRRNIRPHEAVFARRLKTASESGIGNLVSIAPEECRLWNVTRPASSDGLNDALPAARLAIFGTIMSASGHALSARVRIDQWAFTPGISRFIDSLSDSGATHNLRDPLRSRLGFVWESTFITHGLSRQFKPQDSRKIAERTGGN
jgi:hypothetical protein